MKEFLDLMKESCIEDKFPFTEQELQNFISYCSNEKSNKIFYENYCLDM